MHLRMAAVERLKIIGSLVERGFLFVNHHRATLTRYRNPALNPCLAYLLYHSDSDRKNGQLRVESTKLNLPSIEKKMKAMPHVIV